MKETKNLKGYLKRPILLLGINIGYLIYPIVNLIFVLPSLIAFFNQIGRINDSFAIFIVWEQFIVLVVLAFVAGILLTKMNQVSWWAIVVHSALVLLHNIMIFTFASKYVQGYTSWIILTIFEIVTVLIVIYFIMIRKEFREIFFNKRLRWWESKTRYVIDADATLILKNGKEVHGTIHDISIGGVCAILTDSSGTVDPDEFERIYFNYDNLVFKSGIVVVWEGKNKYGLSFSNYDSGHKRTIKSIISHLKKNQKKKDGR